MFLINKYKICIFVGLTFGLKFDARTYSGNLKSIKLQRYNGTMVQGTRFNNNLNLNLYVTSYLIVECSNCVT